MGKVRLPSLSSVASLVKLALLLAVIYFVVRCIDATADDDVQIAPTPVVIQDVKPIGELYAYTAITENYFLDNLEHVGVFTRSYPKAVQTLRQQVSYVINLDSVEYERREGTDTVVVRLPQLRFVQSSQGGNLLCEAEVDMRSFNAADAIDLVAHQIKRDYDTRSNRQKAEARVREVLTAFVQQFRLVPVFEDR